MSVLSIQINELREMAKAYENCGDCGQTSALLREAADTIESLRERLQDESLGWECEAIHDAGYYRGINGICEGLYCSKCGEPLSSKFRHCPWCGAKIKAVK